MKVSGVELTCLAALWLAHVVHWWGDYLVYTIWFRSQMEVQSG